MNKTFFISDLHFHHKNILKYEPIRMIGLIDYLKLPVENDTNEKILNMLTQSAEDCEYIMDAHDKMLIKAWNSVVKANDTVWVLGDVFCSSKEIAKNIISQLNGNKRLIKGNHDKWSDSVYYEMGFQYVSKYPIILKHRFILSHAPLPDMNINTSFFYIYGHVHSHINYQTKTINSQCVCCERSNFTPVEIPEFNNAQ